jgi:hypothetical protein
MKMKKRKLKRVRVGYIEIDPELYKEVRWIARRDREIFNSRVTFRSLIVEGLRHVCEASHFPDIEADHFPDIRKSQTAGGSDTGLLQ